jgi:hypothetical protein
MSRFPLFFMHDGLNIFEHLQPKGQPRIYARGRLLDHPGTQHQTMRDNLSLSGVFFQDGQKVAT